MVRKFFFLILLACPAINSAEPIDLLETYQRAKSSDPRWAAQKERYFSNRQAKKQGFSRLLPQINAEVRHSNINYDGNSIDLDLTAQKFSDCIETELGGIPITDITLSDTLDSVKCFVTSPASSFSSTTYGVTLNQPLYHLDRWYEYKRSEAVALKAEAELTQAQQDLILKTAELYFSILKAKSEYEVIRSEQKSLSQNLKLVQTRFEKGLAKSTHVYEAQAQFDLGLAAIIQAETLVANAMEELALITRTEQVDTAQMPASIPVETPNPDDVTQWIDAAKRNNVDLKVAQITALIAKRDHLAKKSIHAPTLDFVANYSQTDSGGATSIIDEGVTHNQTYGLFLNIPIYSGGFISATSAQARHRKREAEFMLESARQEITTQVQKQFRLVNNTVRRVQAQRLAIRSNEKAYRAIQNGYSRGANTITEVLRSQRDLYLIKRDFTNAQYDYVLATLRLKRLVGTLDEEDLSTLNSWLEPVKQGRYSQTPSEVLKDNQTPIMPQAPMPALETPEPVAVEENQKPKSLSEALKGWFKK